MIRIYVRKPGEQTGRVYRAKSSVMDMKVAVLGFQFVRAGVITEEEWGTCQETIVEHFGLTVVERICDGRTKRTRSYRAFRWSEILQKK